MASEFTDDLAVLIANAGVAVLNTTMFISSKAAIPPGVGPYLSIIDTGGSGVEYVQNQEAPAYELSSAQLVARAAATEDARVMARAAFDAVVSIVNEDVNGTWYLWIRPVQAKPYDIGLDLKDRLRYAFNVLGYKRP